MERRLGDQLKSAGADRHTVIRRLEDHRGELQSMGVRYLAVFGSLARDEARSDSDIDILVDMERPAGLLKHAHLQNYLAALLEREVEVVPRASIRPELRARISREAVRVL